MPLPHMRSLSSLVILTDGASSSSSSARLGIFICLTTYSRTMRKARGARLRGGIIRAFASGIVYVLSSTISSSAFFFAGFGAASSAVAAGAGAGGASAASAGVSTTGGASTSGVTPPLPHLQLFQVLELHLPFNEFSYAFIFLVLQFLRRLGLVLTLPSVRAITQVGTEAVSLPALASLRFFAAGLIRAIVFHILVIFVSRFRD